MLALSATAQTVTRTQHRAAVANDAVTTGTMTIRKPDYISISTDGGKELLIMEGTKFTMTMGGKKHVTDSRKNDQFATFHAILEAIINGQPIPSADDVTVTTEWKEASDVHLLPPRRRCKDLCHPADPHERPQGRLYRLYHKITDFPLGPGPKTKRWGQAPTLSFGA